MDRSNEEAEDCMENEMPSATSTLVLPKGGGYHPPYGLSPAAQKRKRK